MFIVEGNEITGFQVKDEKTGELLPHRYEHFENAYRDAAGRNESRRLAEEDKARSLRRAYRAAKAR